MSELRITGVELSLAGQNIDLSFEDEPLEVDPQRVPEVRGPETVDADFNRVPGEILTPARFETEEEAILRTVLDGAAVEGFTKHTGLAYARVRIQWTASGEYEAEFDEYSDFLEECADEDEVATYLGNSIEILEDIVRSEALSHVDYDEVEVQDFSVEEVS